MNHSLLGRCIFASVCTVILATGNIVDTVSGCFVNCTMIYSDHRQLNTKSVWGQYFSVQYALFLDSVPIWILISPKNLFCLRSDVHNTIMSTRLTVRQSWTWQTSVCTPAIFHTWRWWFSSLVSFRYNRFLSPKLFYRPSSSWLGYSSTLLSYGTSWFERMLSAIGIVHRKCTDLTRLGSWSCELSSCRWCKQPSDDVHLIFLIVADTRQPFSLSAPLWYWHIPGWYF